MVFFWRQYNCYLGLALILLPVSYRKFIETLLSSFEKAYPTLKEKILQKVYDFHKTCGIGDNCKLLIKKKILGGRSFDMEKQGWKGSAFPSLRLRVYVYVYNRCIIYIYIYMYITVYV